MKDSSLPWRERLQFEKQRAQILIPFILPGLFIYDFIVTFLLVSGRYFGDVFPILGTSVFFHPVFALWVVSHLFNTLGLSVAITIILLLANALFTPVLGKSLLTLMPDGITVADDGMHLTFKRLEEYRKRNASMVIPYSWIDKVSLEKLSLSGGSTEIPVLTLHMNSRPRHNFSTTLLRYMRSYYFARTLQKLPESKIALRLPLSMFPFDLDDQKFFRELTNHLPPELITLETTEHFTSEANPSFTSLWLADNQAAKPDDLTRILPIGQQLCDGKYVIRSVIGSGGLSVVYGADRVHEEEALEAVAIKEMVINIGATRDSRQNNFNTILSEVELLKNLAHPNIVRFQEFFSEGGRVYMVMEALDGRNLRDFVKQAEEPLSEATIISIATQCCTVLSYLHSLPEPVLHRDFTPDNLMLCTDNLLKLIDFNVAQKVINASSKIIVGKNNYMAPEQFCGEFTVCGDLYQLGCTLAFLISAEEPEALTQSDLADVRPDIGSGLKDVVKRLTSPTPEHRYQSANEVSADLEIAQERVESC